MKIRLLGKDELQQGGVPIYPISIEPLSSGPPEQVKWFAHCSELLGYFGKGIGPQEAFAELILDFQGSSVCMVSGLRLKKYETEAKHFEILGELGWESPNRDAFYPEDRPLGASSRDLIAKRGQLRRAKKSLENKNDVLGILDSQIKDEQPGSPLWVESTIAESIGCGAETIVEAKHLIARHHIRRFLRKNNLYSGEIVMNALREAARAKLRTKDK